MAERNMNDHMDWDDAPILDLDIKTEIYFSRKDHPEGRMVPVSVGGKEEFILIPLDVKDGQVIRASGRGKYHSRSGKTGDLYVVVHIKETKFPWKKILLLFALVVAVIAVIFLMLRTSDPYTPPTEATCSHDWVPADCKTPKTCSECGESIGDTSGHAWSEANYNTPKTCTVCGETEGEKKTPASSVGLRDIVSSSSASSVYSGDNLGKHVPENMYDGKLDTNWTEDASGNGVGEYVVFYFDDTYAVYKLRIYIGSHYSAGAYKQNCRPKAITLTFSDGSTEFIRLEDSYDEQIITFNQYYYTDSIKITIEEVYTGTKYPDTVIAELDFVVYKP